jgi:hypothetical protein
MNHDYLDHQAHPLRVENLRSKIKFGVMMTSASGKSIFLTGAT